MKTLDWINVGPVSAERDRDLKNYFFDAGVSKSIVEDATRFLFLGRKGAGKTAVFLHLQDKPASVFALNDIVVPISTGDYNWSAHAALGDLQKSGGAQYKTSWRFVIAIESVKALTAHLEKNLVSLPKRLKKAHDLLIHLFDSPLPSWFDLLKARLFRLSKLKLPSAGIPADGSGVFIDGGEVSFGDVKNDEPLQAALSQNVEAMTRFLEGVLKESVDGCRLFLIFDRLDENWLPKSLNECQLMIGGLIQAGEHFTQEFDGTIRPIVFLREDIFDSLTTINDRNKLKQDCSRTLKWTEESLEKLVLARINFFARAAGARPVQRISNLFDRTTVRPNTSPSRYIFERTFCRPRDLVAYLSKIIEFAKEIREDEAPENREGQLSFKLIFAAEGAYSEYLYEEILDEWRNQLPAIYAHLQAITNNGFTTFTSLDYDQELSKILRTFLDKDALRTVLQRLFALSVIGFFVNDLQEKRFKCFFPTQAYEDAAEFHVHAGLVKRLGLVEVKSSRV